MQCHFYESVVLFCDILRVSPLLPQIVNLQKREFLVSHLHCLYGINCSVVAHIFFSLKWTSTSFLFIMFFFFFSMRIIVNIITRKHICLFDWFYLFLAIVIVVILQYTELAWHKTQSYCVQKEILGSEKC